MTCRCGRVREEEEYNLMTASLGELLGRCFYQIEMKKIWAGGLGAGDGTKSTPFLKYSD